MTYPEGQLSLIYPIIFTLHRLISTYSSLYFEYFLSISICFDYFIAISMLMLVAFEPQQINKTIFLQHIKKKNYTKEEKNSMRLVFLAPLL